MGVAPSTPRQSSSRPQDTAEHLIGTFLGDKSLPLTSGFWLKLLDLPLDRLRWPEARVNQACQVFAQNNHSTRHLAKIFIHLALCLQEASSISSASMVYEKALNAVYISSVFLKNLIENAKSENFEELYMYLDDSEPMPEGFKGDQNIENLVMHSVLSFIGSVDVSPNTYPLHRELLNFLLIAMSTQLRSGPSPSPDSMNPFLDAAMAQESTLVSLVVRKLLVNYITRPRVPLNNIYYSTFSEGSQPGVLQRVGSVAATFVLLPLSYLVSSSGVGSKSRLADCSLHVLLILIHYHICVVGNGPITENLDVVGVSSDPLSTENLYFADNPFSKALENARDVEFDRVDLEGNAHSGPLVRLPFASLFDTIGNCLADDASVLLLYSLVHGNSNFLEYVLVRTDLDTLLMPILETLYYASRRTSDQIYMLLIILLILSQDSSFNAAIHKLILPSVPWYQERLVHQTSLGSLMVIILIRTVKYNLSKLRDAYLHTNCLATLANMAPHFYHLSAYASQRLVSLFDMLSRKYNRLADLKGDKVQMAKLNSIEGDGLAEDVTTELHIYTDFLRIVLEIMNAILTYALPQNPEVVYAIMHRQEVFQPFKNHPRFNELIDNIYKVLDFFNSRMDAQGTAGEWSVEKVLHVININCRSWRAEGLKMFTQLRFTYEQENQSEEFFIPYVWQLALSCCGFGFNPCAINMFPVDLPMEERENTDKLQEGLSNER